MSFFKKGGEKVNQREENIYNNLKNQIDKIHRHNRQGSYETRRRYYQANDRFCRFLATEFGVQKFENISNKHLDAYIFNMQERNLAPATIKNELASIRFFHDKCTNPRYTLKENDAFNLKKRQFGGVDRSWSDGEYKTFLELCNKYNRLDIQCVAVLGRETGLRLHEAMRLDRNAANKAIMSGKLVVKGKGGKVREVPINNNVKNYLNNYIDNYNPSNKLFVEEFEKTHLKIKQVQNFIVRHRDKFQEADREVNRTFHGLRHSYAQERYTEFKVAGLNEYEARKGVSELLGHERDEVTRIYLS